MKLRNYFKYVVYLIVLFGLAIYPLFSVGTDQTHAKNVIFFVGDGMGPSARELIRLLTVGPNGQIAMNDMPYTGLSITNSTSIVTDSAAGATAWASGVKSYNGDWFRCG